jgi:acetate kinase
LEVGVVAGLNEQSGLLGVSSVSADMRKVQVAADDGNERARLAIEIFVHRVVATVGAMVAVLGGLDALVFTGGIGEHSPRIRAEVVSRLAHLGIDLDTGANARSEADAEMTTTSRAARIFVVTAREDLAVLAEVRRLLVETR